LHTETAVTVTKPFVLHNWLSCVKLLPDSLIS